MALSPSEAQFIDGVAAQTGVDARVLIAWAQAEGAYAPNGTGGFNFFNLRPYPGDPYSSVSAGNFEQFSNVQDAVTATVRRIKQPFLWSTLGPVVQNKGTPRQEITAIAASNWDGGHYGGPGGPNLQRDLNQLFPGALDSPYVGGNGVAVTSTVGTGSAADAGSIDLGGAAGAAGAAVGAAAGTSVFDLLGIGAFGDFFHFLTSWRFAEVVGGFLLLLLGVALLAKQFGVPTPLSIPTIPGSAPAPQTTSDSSAMFDYQPGEFEHNAAQPTSRAAKTRMRRVKPLDYEAVAA